jgi:probable phosphoglycerate mutase
MFVHPFYAMRHGETSWNAKGLFQGHSDVPLSEEGIRQVKGNGRRLKQHLDHAGINSSEIGIFSSPLSRALHSSRIILAELGIPESRLAIDPRLKEASFGHWEGLTTFEVRERFREERSLRKRDRWNFAPSGGQSYADISSVMSDFLGAMKSGNPSLFVTHTGNIRAILRLLLDIEREEAMATRIPHDRFLYWNGAFARWI